MSEKKELVSFGKMVKEDKTIIGIGFVLLFSVFAVNLAFYIKLGMIGIASNINLIPLFIAIAVMCGINIIFAVSSRGVTTKKTTARRVTIANAVCGLVFLIAEGITFLLIVIFALSGW